MHLSCLVFHSDRKLYGKGRAAQYLRVKLGVTSSTDHGITLGRLTSHFLLLCKANIGSTLKCNAASVQMQKKDSKSLKVSLPCSFVLTQTGQKRVLLFTEKKRREEKRREEERRGEERREEKRREERLFNNRYKWLQSRWLYFFSVKVMNTLSRCLLWSIHLLLTTL